MQREVLKIDMSYSLMVTIAGKAQALEVLPTALYYPNQTCSALLGPAPLPYV